MSQTRKQKCVAAAAFAALGGATQLLPTVAIGGGWFALLVGIVFSLAPAVTSALASWFIWRPLDSKQRWMRNALRGGFTSLVGAVGHLVAAAVAAQFPDAGYVVIQLLFNAGVSVLPCTFAGCVLGVYLGRDGR